MMEKNQRPENPSKIKVAIIIPAYNEEIAVLNTIKDYQNFFPEAHIVAVNNNSNDQTETQIKKALRSENDFYVFEKQQGKGHAVRKGLKFLDADIFILTDADFTYPAAEARKCFDILLKNRCDLVCGDRLSAGAYVAQNQRFGHSLGNRTLTSLISSVAQRKYKDVLTGLRIMPSPFVEMLGIRSSGFQIETEMNLVAAHLLCDIEEVPIKYVQRPAGSISKLNSIRDGIRILGAAFVYWILYKPLRFSILTVAVCLFLATIAVIRPLIDLSKDGILSMDYVGSFSFASMMGIVAALAAVVGVLMQSTISISRRQDIANFATKMRKWNDKINHTG